MSILQMNYKILDSKTVVDKMGRATMPSKSSWNRTKLLLRVKKSETNGRVKYRETVARDKILTLTQNKSQVV